MTQATLTLQTTMPLASITLTRAATCTGGRPVDDDGKDALIESGVAELNAVGDNSSAA